MSQDYYCYIGCWHCKTKCDLFLNSHTPSTLAGTFAKIQKNMKKVVYYMILLFNLLGDQGVKMDEILGVLGHHDLSQEDCMSYLTRNPDVDSDLSMLFVDNSTLLEAGKIVTKLSNKEESCPRHTLIRIAAVILSNVVDNEDISGIILRQYLLF